MKPHEEDVYLPERKKLYRFLRNIFVLIIVAAIIAEIYHRSWPKEERITLYISNPNNDNLLKITTKRCFLTYPSQARKLRDGDIVDSVTFSLPTYIFSSGKLKNHENIFKHCPEGHGGETYASISSSNNIPDNALNFIYKETKKEIVNYVGADKINTIFIPTDRSSTKKMMMYYHVTLDSKERQKYHGPFLNSYLVYSPLNDDLAMEYKMYTRFYRYLPVITDDHKHFNITQCVSGIAYCVDGNPADLIYDSIQRQENLLDCHECIASILTNDAKVAEFFLNLSHYGEQK